MQYRPEDHPDLSAPMNYLPLPRWAVEYSFAAMDFLESNRSEWAKVGKDVTSRTGAKQTGIGNNLNRTTISHKKKNGQNFINIRQYAVQPNLRKLFEYQWNLLEPTSQDVIVRTYIPGGKKPETVRRDYFARRDHKAIRRVLAEALGVESIKINNLQFGDD